MSADAALPRTRTAIEEGIRQGLHLGAQIYLSHNGATVADSAFGEVRPGEPLTPDHLMLWLSSTKPVGAVALARLWERGRLELDDPIVRFIPEFGANGKDRITLRHILTHTAGIRMLDVGWPAVHGVDLTPVPVEAAEQPDRLLHGELLGELRLLELDAEPLAERALVAVPPLPEHFDHALVGRRESLADLDRRRRPRAIRAEQPEALPRGHREIEAVHGDDVAEALPQTGDAQRRLSRGHAHAEHPRAGTERDIRESYEVVSRGVSAAESRGVSARIGSPSNQSRPSTKHSRTPSSPAASRSRKSLSCSSMATSAGSPCTCRRARSAAACVIILFTGVFVWAGLR